MKLQSLTLTDQFECQKLAMLQRRGAFIFTNVSVFSKKNSYNTPTFIELQHQHCKTQQQM